MKVVFLDVDGVLVHSKTIPLGRASREPSDSSFFFAAQVDPECIARVLRIVEATGAKVVVSSVWRRFDAHSTGLRRAFLTAGVERRALRDLLVGSTPYLGHVGKERPEEITAWLAEHPEVTKYVVLDDGPIEGHPQGLDLPNHFTGGLLDHHADEAIRILNAE